MRRLLGGLIAAGSVGYLAVLAPTIVKQASAVASWWTIAAMLAVFVPPIALGVASYHFRLPVTRRIAGIAAPLYVVATVTWPLAWDGTHGETTLWISMFPALAALAAVLVWSPQFILCVLVLVTGSAQFIDHLWRAASFDSQLITAVYSLSVTTAYVAPAWMLMRTGRLLDQSSEWMFENSAEAAASQARLQTRARFDSVAHDWFMATLLATARHEDRETLRRQARSALDQLDSLREDERSDYETPALVDYLRATMTDVDATLVVDVTIAEHTERKRYPAQVAYVIAAAAAEAVRNSVRHGGPHARRAAEVMVDEGELKVVVADDGKGFDLGAVDPSRLGLRISVTDRMTRLPGGHAAIASRPGEGTRVELSWTTPEQPAGVDR